MRKCIGQIVPPTGSDGILKNCGNFFVGYKGFFRIDFPAQLFNDEDAYVILDNDDNGSDNEKEESDLGKALYLYNQAAVAAFY